MVQGYQPAIRTREVVCTWESLAPRDESPPLKATIRAGLTFGQIDQIPDPHSIENGQMMVRVTEELRIAIAPLILAWNCVAEDLVTGDLVPVSPPAEAGPDAFRAVDWLIAGWLASELRTLHRGDAQKKARSESTPETSPGDDSDSVPKKTTSARNRKDSAAH